MKDVLKKVCLLALVFFTGCKYECNCRNTGEEYEFDWGVICNCIVTPDSGGKDTYLLSVSEDGVVTTSYGEFNDYLFKTMYDDKELPRRESKLLNYIESGERIIISQKKINEVKRLVRQADKAERINTLATSSSLDGRIVILMTEKKQFIYSYGDKTIDKDINKLTNMLIELSPYPVDLLNRKMDGITLSDDQETKREFELREKIDSLRRELIILQKIDSEDNI